MQKQIGSLVMGIVVLMFAVTASASDLIQITADSERFAIAKALTEAYCTEVNVQPTPGESAGDSKYVTIIGPGGKEKINISDELLVKLQKYASNPTAGQQLMELCPTQAGQFQKAWGSASMNRQQKVFIAGVFAPDSMRLIADGDVCDENSFSGDVVEAALETSGGKSVSVIELHQRSGKSMPFKGKRLYIDADTQRAIPFVWASTGKCVRKYDTKPLSQVKLQSMMTTCETTQAADFSEIGQDGFGSHLTEGVIVIFGQ